MPERLRIGELLVQSRAVTPETLEKALRAQATSGSRLGSALVELGVDPIIVSRALSLQLRVPAVDEGRLSDIPRPTLSLLSAAQAERLRAVPFRWREKQVDVAVMDPPDEQTLSALSAATGFAVKPYIATEAQLRLALRRHYGIAQSPEASAPEAVEIELERTPPHGTEVDTILERNDEAPPLASKAAPSRRVIAPPIAPVPPSGRLGKPPTAPSLRPSTSAVRPASPSGEYPAVSAPAPKPTSPPALTARPSAVQRAAALRPEPEVGTTRPSGARRATTGLTPALSGASSGASSGAAASGAAAPGAASGAASGAAAPGAASGAAFGDAASRAFSGASSSAPAPGAFSSAVSTVLSGADEQRQASAPAGPLAAVPELPPEPTTSPEGTPVPSTTAPAGTPTRRITEKLELGVDNGLSSQRSPSGRLLPPEIPEALGECAVRLYEAERLSEVMEAVLTFCERFFAKTFIFRVTPVSYSVLMARAPTSLRLKVEALVLRARSRTPFDVIAPPTPFYLGPLAKGAEEEGLLSALEQDLRAPVFLMPMVPLPTHQLLLFATAPTTRFDDSVVRQMTVIGDKARLALHIQQLRKRLRTLPADW